MGEFEGYTKSDANEDEGGPQSLPGRGGKLETVEEHVAHPRLVQRWVTRGELCTDVLVKDGHGDHGLGCVQHVVHDDEEVAVHSLDWDEEKKEPTKVQACIDCVADRESQIDSSKRCRNILSITV